MEGNALVTTRASPVGIDTRKRFLQEDGSMKVETSISHLSGPRAGATEKGWQVFTKAQ
jgi:hypothetical protein